MIIVLIRFVQNKQKMEHRLSTMSWTKSADITVNVLLFLIESIARFLFRNVCILIVHFQIR